MSVIDTATNTVVATISLGGPTASIAITPDGKTAYVVGFAGEVTPIDLATNTAGATFSAGSTSFGIAIAPDGGTAYVVNEFSGSVTPFLTATDTALPPIPVTTLAVADAITPDGKTLYVTNTGTSPGMTNAVTAISTATNEPEGAPIPIGELTFEIAITPAQAPTAAFAAQAGGAGQPTRFDASASSATHGSIATYRWEFGDGTIETTASATTSHTYAAPGTYTARLTVTDDEGCSTAFVFTGQTASCNGSSRASAAGSVTVAASPAPALLQRAPVPPLISGLRARARCVSHASLAGAPSSGASGLAFSYTLNEQASVLYVVKRRNASPGRRSCGPAPGRVPGGYTEVGGVVGPGAAGVNGVSLGGAARSPAGRGRAGHTISLHLTRAGLAAGRHRVTLAQLAPGKRLAPGTYVLLARATNAAGQRSNDAMVKFFVTR
jgi:PKD repeat protein